MGTPTVQGNNTNPGLTNLNIYGSRNAAAENNGSYENVSLWTMPGSGNQAEPAAPAPAQVSASRTQRTPNPSQPAPQTGQQANQAEIQRLRLENQQSLQVIARLMAERRNSASRYTGSYGMQAAAHYRPGAMLNSRIQSDARELEYLKQAIPAAKTPAEKTELQRRYACVLNDYNMINGIRNNFRRIRGGNAGRCFRPGMGNMSYGYTANNPYGAVMMNNTQNRFIPSFTRMGGDVIYSDKTLAEINRYAENAGVNYAQMQMHKSHTANIGSFIETVMTLLNGANRMTASIKDTYDMITNSGKYDRDKICGRFTVFRRLPAFRCFRGLGNFPFFQRFTGFNRFNPFLCR